MSRTILNRIIGAAVFAAAIGGLFWYLGMFRTSDGGEPLRLADIGCFGWVILAKFGMGFMAGGWRKAVKWAWVWALIWTALIVGRLVLEHNMLLFGRGSG